MASFGLASAIAQNGSGINGDGYYRVKNLGSGRYIYVTDNKDYSDMYHDAEDFQAIQLWKDKDVISDPATVIYIELNNNSGKYDLKGQGTGVHELTGYYVSIKKVTTGANKGTYQVSATKGGVTKTLSDDSSGREAQGQLGTSNKGLYSLWVVDSIGTQSETNYFGIKPTIEVNGKYYQPFYAGFPFMTESPNMHVYYVSKIAGDVATLKEITGVIPAGSPVIIECASPESTDNRLKLLKKSSDKIKGNKLSGAYFCNGERPAESKEAYTVYDAATMRVFTESNGKLILSKNAPNRVQEIEAIDWETEDYIYPQCIPANTSYLSVSAGTPAVLDIHFEAAGLDDIIAEKKETAVKGVYTLSGTQVRSTNDVQGLPTGLYIVGGVKVAVK